MVNFLPDIVQKNINLEILESLLLLLRLKCEIERTVAGVNQLRRLCSNLRQRLDRTRTTQAALADALFDQALAT